MRRVYFLFILSFIILINTAVIKKISKKDKRSVFDIISNVGQNITEHVINLSLYDNDMKQIKYKDLKNIFNLSKKEKKHNKNKHKKRKKDIKNHFLEGSRAEHKLKQDPVKKENVFVNFNFLTKLS